MKTTNDVLETGTKEIVLALIDAINKEDFQTARTYVTDDFKFNGVLGARDGAEAYFKDMQEMKLKYDIKKTFTDGNDACIFYEIEMAGKKIFCCGWYHLRDQRVSSLRVVFDPRPVLEAQQKK
jgi:hypothetical protein